MFPLEKSPRHFDKYAMPTKTNHANMNPYLQMLSDEEVLKFEKVCGNVCPQFVNHLVDRL